MLALSPQKPVVSAGEGTVQSKVRGTRASSVRCKLSCGFIATAPAALGGVGLLLSRTQAAALCVGVHRVAHILLTCSP